MQSAKNPDTPILETTLELTNCPGRICSLAANNNLIYIGTVGGDIMVSSIKDRRILSDRSWL
jgi:hypothetical protein